MTKEEIMKSIDKTNEMIIFQNKRLIKLQSESDINNTNEIEEVKQIICGYYDYIEILKEELKKQTI